MKTRLYYHAYLDDNYLWTQIMLEQFKLMEDSGLMPNIEKICITAIGQRGGIEDTFVSFIKLYNVPFEIDFLYNRYPNDQEMLTGISNNYTERYTLKKMYDHCQTEDLTVLYLHTKNVTSLENNFKRGMVSKYRNRYYWRRFIDQTITFWSVLQQQLDNNDVCGVNYTTDPTEHFSGNFFWSKSEHIRSLPSPEQNQWWYDLQKRKNHPWMNTVDERFASEMWICSRPDTKAFNLMSNNGDYIANDI